MKKKILFVNDEMTMGGVARILNTFLKMIDRDKYDVDLLVLHKRGELLKEIPEGISVYGGTKFFDCVDIPLSSCKPNQLFSKLRLLFYMKTGLIKNKIKKERQKILKKHYDIEFSAKEGFCTIFTAYGDSDKKINWIQVDYKQNNYSSNHMKLVKEALGYIDVNIACSNIVKKSYQELFGIDNIIVIHNLVDEDVIREKSLKQSRIKTSDDKINMICVARFHNQKGVDRLIEAYAKVSEYYELFIIGDGELKDELHRQARELKIDNRIHWQGISSNPYPDIKKSDCLILPSRYEGYPTITIETLISGTPVLALEVAGIKEQIIADYMGKVVENSDEALLNMLLEFKDKKELLQEYKQKLSSYKYNNQKILDEYYESFEQH